MSFSSKVKNEICRFTEMSKKEAMAELAAIMKVSGTIGLGSNKAVNFQTTTENPAIARLIFKLLKEHFAIHARILVKRSNSVKKNNMYVVIITEEMGVKDFLKK